jgi:3-phosphoshikimate 1-carboxyvinyltransferase
MPEVSRTYPDVLAVEPLTRPPAAHISVPGSKSITNRALVLGALSDPRRGSTLRNVLASEDSEIMIAALRQLGFAIQIRGQKATFDLRPSTFGRRSKVEDPSSAPASCLLPSGSCVVHICRGQHASPVPAAHADLYVGNSGTTMRFLTALVSLGNGSYRLDGVSRMRERPIEDLLAALRLLGAHARSETDNGYPPVLVEARGLNGGRIRIRGDMSSQFLSGLLMAAPLARGDVRIDVEGVLVSQPYVALTVHMMQEFGATVESDLRSYFRVSSQPWYSTRDFVIEPDATAAGYFLAAAAITRGEVTVKGLSKRSLQGDGRFVDILTSMGCRHVFDSTGVTVCGGPLKGIAVDMNAMSDCVMTLAAVACFAQGPTTIYNVAHIRHKETDRLDALVQELRKVGVDVQEFPDGLKISPGPLHGGVIETYNDHRIAMSMALIGLVTPGVILKNPSCVAKTYPGFFEDLARLRT